MINLHCFFLIMKPNSESKHLDQCTIHESYSLNEVFDGFCYNIFNRYKLTGENCNGNYDCFSNICENNKCKGKLENEECYEHGECDVGLGNKSLMNKYIDSRMGHSFIDIDNDYKIFFYNNIYNRK